MPSHNQGLLRVSLIALSMAMSVACSRTPDTSANSPSLPSVAPSVAVSPTPTTAPSVQPPATQSFNTAPAPKPTQAIASVATETCRITQAVVADPDAPLNVRSSPNAEADNVVGQLSNNTWVLVNGERDGWLQIKSTAEPEVEGWIAKNRTKSACNQKIAYVSFPQQGGTVAIADQFVGTGSHEYVFNANQGQTLNITNQNGVFPMILAPDGQPLITGPYEDSRSDWRGELPVSGEYKLMFDSNFKGYEYNLAVGLQ